jgi:hypothetical protein
MLSKENSVVAYAKVGGPPTFWHLLMVYNADTGEEIKDVVEFNLEEGWVRKYKRNNDGSLAHNHFTVCVEQIHGNFASLLNPFK